MINLKYNPDYIHNKYPLKKTHEVAFLVLLLVFYVFLNFHISRPTCCFDR